MERTAGVSKPIVHIRTTKEEEEGAGSRLRSDDDDDSTARRDSRVGWLISPLQASVGEREL